MRIIVSDYSVLNYKFALKCTIICVIFLQKMNLWK